jgi:Tfp pilus assembly protein PilO
MASKTSAWVAGSTVAALVVAAGAWFGLISPTLAHASDQRQTASDQRDRNVILETQIAKLKAQYAHLDDYKTQLTALHQQMPSTGDLAEANREIQSVAQTAGVTITVVQPGTPTAFVAPAAASTPTPTPTASSSTAAATGDTKASTPTQPTAVDGLYTIPLSVTTLGTYAQTVAFVDGLQQSMPRLFVVTTVDATSQKSSGATVGRPALADGDLQATLTGVLLTFRDASGAAPTPGATVTPTPAPTQLPVPTDQKNPFLPVGH